MYQRIPGPYRGYKGGRKKWFIFLAVILLLLFTMLTAFFLLQDYLVFSVDGVRLELPFFQPKEKNKDLEKTEDLPLEIITPEPAEKPLPGTDEGADTGTMPVSAPVLRAVYADADKLADAEYLNGLLSLPGLNAVLIDLKFPDGSVTYLSKAAPENAKAKVTDAVLNAIKTFSENGVYIIGQMSALRDNIAPRSSMRQSALKTANSVTWLDYKNVSWFNPYDAQTSEYLCALTREAAELGCDELLLYNFCFPVAGKTELIAYPEQSPKERTPAINRLLEAAGDAAAGSGMILSVMAEDTALAAGSDEKAGQDLPKISQTGRLYFNADDPAYLIPERWETIASGAFEAGKLVPVFKTSRSLSLLAGFPEEIKEKSGYLLLSENGAYDAAYFK